MNISTGEEKAALLLKILPSGVSEGLLVQLGSDKAARLRAQIKRLEKEPGLDAAIDGVLHDLEDLVQVAARDSLRIAGQAAEARIASENGGGARTSESSGDLSPESAALAALGQIDPARLAAALKGEHPRMIALVLNNLETDQAGELLKRLPQELRREVSLQLSKAETGGPVLLERIAQALVTKSSSLDEAQLVNNTDARFKKIANMLRVLDKADRMELLALLEENDALTAAHLKEWLYQFDDLLVMEPRSIQKLLAEIDSKTLAAALKGASEAITQKVLNNLSKRARDSLTEEMEYLGSISPADVQKAQKALVEVIQRLDQAGELVTN
jgi:flagellar motor switch protein FliG